MEIIILENPQVVYMEVASRINGQIQKKPGSILGLATGKTMQGVYQKLIATAQESNLDFSQVSTFNLDEYLGIPPDDPLTFNAYMLENLFRWINIKAENIFIPSTLPQNVDKECQRYEDLIKNRGGIDLQLLGIGREGHIGFNEPSSSLQARTRVKTLTDVTRKDNFGEADGPRFAITMGIGTIMEAREIIMVATGKEKAKIIADAIEGPVTASCPASILQFHPQAKIIIDADAASLLQRRDYYEWVYAHKKEVENLEIE